MWNSGKVDVAGSHRIQSRDHSWLMMRAHTRDCLHLLDLSAYIKKIVASACNHPCACPAIPLGCGSGQNLDPSGRSSGESEETSLSRLEEPGITRPARPRTSVSTTNRGQSDRCPRPSRAGLQSVDWLNSSTLHCRGQAKQESSQQRDGRAEKRTRAIRRKIQRDRRASAGCPFRQDGTAPIGNPIPSPALKPDSSPHSVRS